MRALACMLLLAVPVACGASTGGATTASTDLQITVWPRGKEDGQVKRFRLRCGPAGGTLPRPGRACVRLNRIDRPWAPVPKDMACTEIYGGPAVATVEGIHRGKRVRASFRRTNGCEIGRWNRVGFLFPVPLSVE